MKTILSRLSHAFTAARTWLTTGRGPYIFITIYLVITSLLVYLDSQSLVAFLLFLGSAWFIYSLPTRPAFKIALGLVLALGIIPVIGSRNIFYFEVIFQICVFAALALGLNIVVGFAGLLNLGYVAFYAVGAYLWAYFGSQQAYLLTSIPGSAPLNTPFLLPADAFYLFLFLGMGLAAVVGILLGLPVLRVRGDYLAIVTLGFGEVIRVLANNLDKPVNLTNGPQGITPIQRPTLSAEVQGGLNTVLSPLVGRPLGEGEFYNLFFYLIALLIILMVIFIVRRLDDFKVGRAWAAVREDELAAAAMGIPVVQYKLAAFAVGASFAGIMGVLFAASRTFVSPESFNFMQSIGVLSMVILGGLGSIPGVIVGAAVVVVLNTQVLQAFSLYLNSLRQSNDVIPIINFAWRNLSSQLDPAKYQRMIFGLILIVMMIYRQNGLIPAIRKLRGGNGTGQPIEEDDPPANGAASQEVPHGAA